VSLREAGIGSDLESRDRRRRTRKNLFRKGNVGHIITLMRENGCRQGKGLHCAGMGAEGSLSQ